MESGRGTAKPLIVIVGQTASGKSQLALEVANRFSSEIICADSRTVYKEMDIGTAKPALAERQQISHHMLDIITPDQTFSAAQFQLRAKEIILDIHSRGNVPIMVGGSGLYIDGVIFDYSFASLPDPAQRARLNSLSVEELQAALLTQGIVLPGNDRNPRHLIRALETGGVKPQRSSTLRSHTLVVGLRVERVEIRRRIADRVRMMIAAGYEAEVRRLAAAYDWEVPGLRVLGYREWRPYFENQATLEQTIERIELNTWQRLAKPQATWFARNSYIEWHTERSKIVDSITTFLSNYS